jgi:zinc resistance-associated protein
MWKMALAGTATLAIVGATLVHAQEGWRRGNDIGGRGGAEQTPLTAEDRAAFADARIAALKAGLKLTPDQERNWPAFEEALRALAKARSERLAQRDTQPASDDPLERLRLRADAVSRTGTLLKQLVDAAQPLYQSLDEAQKRRFWILAHQIRASMRHHRMGHDRGREWRGRGDDRDWHGRDSGRGWGGRDDGWRRRDDDRDWRGHDSGRGWGGRDDGRRSGERDDGWRGRDDGRRSGERDDDRD